MKIKNLFYAMLMALALSACMATPQKPPAMTPLEIQSLQSREYEAAKEVVFPSVISVFQDIGYTINNADIQTGLIYAESSASSGYLFWESATIVRQTRATGFVERIGDKTRIRLNFVEVHKTSSTQGQTSRQDTPLLDAKLYENAFEKIENAIFMRASS